MDTSGKSFKHKGQLRLALKVTNGSLKVHIVQAKHLCSRWRPTCNPYAQVLLVPDETKKSLCQTEVLPETNNPRFGATFTYELMPEDERKRLMISVWHEDTGKGCSEFLGCMSFGVKHLIGRTAARDVEGWYYLLSENLGHRKHLVASLTSQSQSDGGRPPLSDSREPQSDVKVTSSSMDDIPDVHHKANNMEELSMVIHKNSAGYGFTIRGSCPVRVGRIKAGSTSALCGLRSGDYITRINGQNVTRSKAEYVAEIVKKSDGVIVMDVRRPVRAPVCVIDDGEFLKPDGTEGDTGALLDQENMPPPPPPPQGGTPNSTSSTLSSYHQLSMFRDSARRTVVRKGKVFSRLHGDENYNTTPGTSVTSSSTHSFTRKQQFLLPKISNMSQQHQQQRSEESHTSSVLTEHNVLLTQQVELRNVVNTTYQSIREIDEDRAPARDSSQTVPKSADFSTSDSAYGSHGDGSHGDGSQRTSGSSIAASEADSSKDRRQEAAALLTPINELEEALVLPPESCCPLVGEHFPRLGYERWDPSISIITRFDSARSLFYTTRQSSASSVASSSFKLSSALHRYETPRPSSPPLYDTGCSESRLFNTECGAEEESSLFPLNCDTINDFCDEESFPLHNTMADPGMYNNTMADPEQSQDARERGGGEQMCTYPQSMLVSPLASPKSAPAPEQAAWREADQDHCAPGHLSEMSDVSRLPLRSSTPDLPFYTTEQEETYISERQSATCRTLQCEEEFSALMHVGIQRYSRPLRHCIISPRQHQQLFQNIEKLVALSEFHIRQLIETSYCGESTRRESLSQHVSVESVGQVYKPKVRMLCEAYELYKAGLPTALQTLQSLRDHAEFCHFTGTQSTADFSLHEFLQKPVSHLADLHGNLVQVLETTEESHKDFSTLQFVIKVIEETCSRIVPGFAAPESEAVTASSTARNTNPFTAPTVDIQVLELQERLVFSKGVKPFQLTSATRHLIFSGDLVFVRSDMCATLTVTLLSDMLLLMVKERGEKLRVVDDPIILTDINKLEFSRLHPSEFSLTVEKTMGGHQSRRNKNYVFRAPDLEHKCAWKSILEHRVKLCKPQQEPSPLAVTELTF